MGLIQFLILDSYFLGRILIMSVAHRFTGSSAGVAKWSTKVHRWQAISVAYSQLGRWVRVQTRNT